MTSATPRRADAQRNRARLLDAAREVLARRGSAASMDEVARTAGLGAGTLYRHFPDRHRLFTAMFAEVMEETEADFEAARHETDPEAALYGCLRRFAARASSNRALVDAIGADLDEATDAEINRRRAHGIELLDEVADRAKAAGALRPDVTATDLVWLVRCVATLGVSGPTPDALARYLSIVFDGLHPRAVAPDTDQAPA